MKTIEKTGPMTLLVCAVAIIVVVVGGIAVLTGRYDDDFRQWVNDLVLLAGASGVLGVGRGILKGKQEEAKAIKAKAAVR